MRRHVSSGFTLIELLVTVVVVAILAAIAIPSYSAYVARGQRAAAKAALMQAAQFLERNYTAAGCYNYTASADCTNQSGTTGLVLPAPLQASPTDGGPATYALSLTIPTTVPAGQAFQLTAAPCATAGNCPAGSNTSFSDPECGTLSLDNTGLKGASGGTLPATTCWQR